MTSFTKEELLFHAVRNAQYHTARRQALEFWSRLATTLSILLGTAVVAEAAGKVGLNVVWLGIATAATGIVQLVFDFGGRARTHELLQRRYYDLVAAIRRTPEPSAADVAEWGGIISVIYGEEPPMDPVAEALAYNAAGNALGMRADEALIIPWWLRLLAPLGLANGWRFETRAESDARRNPKLAN